MERDIPTVNTVEKILVFIARLLNCGFLLCLCYLPCAFLYLAFATFWSMIKYTSILILPSLVIGLIYFKNKKRFIKYWVISLAVFSIMAGINFVWLQYDESITIDTAPSINVREYLPFREDSKIIKLDHEASLQLTGDLPIVDGAAAVFPVYSAFVNAVYPDSTELNDGVFEYRNTVSGYRALGKKQTDIFFGAFPSKDQISEAAENGTTFVYTPIGMEAFVFFVHKDNPVDNLTSEQVRMIYSGEITNWKEVGGSNEPITPYQRNKGSGSQSMFLRFMGDTIPMEPSTETEVGGMLEIIDTVSDYRNKAGSIGFSFRYYMEGIIQNPDVKLLSIDGVAPTVENIQNGTYPITASLYAVTYEGNDNENVALLLEWVLSDEGQAIIENTGYVPLSK